MNSGTSFSSLTANIAKLLEQVSRITHINSTLREKLKSYEEGLAEKKYLERITELENDLRKVRKENKTLKERERLIKNKVERLSVKLEKLEV
ncbi:MAG: hypothetical protein AAFP70_02530 [Calditrichota bacterium]